METAIAVRLKFYKDGATFAQWQNFWVDKTIDGYGFVNFTTGEILMNRTADEGGVALSVAATQAHLQLFETAIANEHLCLIEVLEMPAGSSSDPAQSTLIAKFVGEVVAMDTDLTQINVALGAAMDAISGDIPGRKITTSLVGRLPSL
jgi:hypothetical protein